jgi:hemerythrin-like domain-containing protein
MQPTRPTEILVSEHCVIESVLDCLEAIAFGLRDQGDLDGDDVASVLDFVRCFADERHHAKEEERLFPMMEGKGLPAHGPTSVMRSEHEQGRNLVRRMEIHLAGAAQPGRDRDRFVECALGFVDLLRQHILKENHILFPMAESMMTDDERAALLREFLRVDAESAAEGDRQRAVAMELAAKYGAPVVASE